MERMTSRVEEYGVHASSFADAALEFHKAGLNVIPVITGEKRPPRGFRWRRWQKDSQTDRDLAHLRRRYPDYGTAVILGGPGDLVDLEGDGTAGERLTVPRPTVRVERQDLFPVSL